MCFDKLMGDRQAKAEPAVSARRSTLMKSFKDMRQDRGRNSRSRISNGHFDNVIELRNGYPHLAARGSKFDSVRQEIRYDLLESARVRFD